VGTLIAGFNFSMPKGEKHSSALVINGALLTNKQRLASFQQKTAKQLALIGRAEKENVTRRVAVGVALHVIKESLPHGEWTPWTEKHVLTQVGQRQMHYIMAAGAVFIEQCAIKPPEVAALTGGKFTLAAKEGPLKKLAAAATDFVGDLTWGELLAKHEIKEGPVTLGGARAHAAAKPKSQSAEQLYLFARDEIGSAIETVERVIVKDNLLAHLVDHPQEVAGVVESLRRVADEVEKAAKPLLKK
jgi:hypothetical protein